MPFFTFIHPSGEFYSHGIHQFPEELRFRFQIGSFKKYLRAYPNVYVVVPIDCLGNLLEGFSDEIKTTYVGIEARIKEEIIKLGFKNINGIPYIPIGTALEINFEEPQKPRSISANTYPLINTSLIVAPIMLRAPQDITSTRNTYYATKAVLRLVAKRATGIGTEVVIPPLGIEGKMSMEQICSQMADAFKEKEKRVPNFDVILNQQPRISGNHIFFLKGSEPPIKNS